MKRNEVKRSVVALTRVAGRDVFVWVEYRRFVAGFAGSARSANGTFQDVWAVSDEHDNWYDRTPRQLRRSAVQQCQDTLIAARKGAQ